MWRRPAASCAYLLKISCGETAYENKKDPADKVRWILEAGAKDQRWPLAPFFYPPLRGLLLELVKLLVNAVLGKECLVGALFPNAAFVHNKPLLVCLAAAAVCHTGKSCKMAERPRFGTVPHTNGPGYGERLPALLRPS